MGVSRAARSMARSQAQEKNAKLGSSDRAGAQRNAAATSKQGAPAKGSLRIGPVEVLLAVMAGAIAWGVFQKQNADALVGQCAQRHERADYDAAMGLCSSALAIYASLNEYTRLLGWRNGIFWADVAQTTDNIGVVHMNLGNNAVALKYHQAALALREQHLGLEHLDVAATRDNLGLVYRQMNDLDKALEFHNRALEIRLNAVGQTDLATAASKTAIANIHYQREQYTEALSLYGEVLTTQTQLLGNDHLDVAATLQNIGTVLRHSDLNASWDRFENSLAIIVGVYGHNHRTVADTLNSMGGVRYAQENWDGALETYQQALDIALSVLGSQHPDVAATLSNLGAVFEKLGKTPEAEEKFEQVVSNPALVPVPPHFPTVNPPLRACIHRTMR